MLRCIGSAPNRPSPSGDLGTRMPQSCEHEVGTEGSACVLVVSLGCTEAQECWDPIVRYHMSLRNVRLGCKCLKQLEHSLLLSCPPPPPLPPASPLQDLATMILTAEPMYCFHSHLLTQFCHRPFLFSHFSATSLQHFPSERSYYLRSLPKFNWS